MDEVVGDELTPLDGTEGRRLQSKESEFQRKSESGSMLESRERITTGENEFRETSSLLLVDILDGKNVARSLSSVDPLEHTSVSPHSVDNVGGMVEELTIRNYCNLNLASVGPSNSRVRIGNGGNQWQHIYQTAGGLATHGYSVNREGTGIWEDGGCKPLSEFLSQKSSRDNCNEVVDRSPHSETKETLGDVLVHGGIRTKILSKSGFSEFFVKNTLKGKGIICRGPPSENFFAECKNQNDVNVAHGSKMAADALLSSPAVVDKPAANSTSGTKVVVTSEHEGINMREWISIGHRDLNKVVRLNIFRQIVYLVDYYHSKGIALPDLRPSRFVLLPSNQVKFLGSLLELEGENSGIVSEKHLLGSGDQIILKRAPERGSFYPYNFGAKKQKVNEDVNYAQQWPQFCSKPALKGETASGSEMNATDPQISGYVYCSQKPSTVYGLKKFGSLLTANPAAESLTNATCQLEERWYKSPEEVGTGASQISSNIYCLGVFLFELLGRFDSERARNVAMMDLRHRILPPSFLSENPKEAGFCLWLLHPEPSSRPTSRGILESEVLSELKEVSGEDLSFSIEQDDEESELLMHFLIALKEHKQKSASKLIEDLNCLEADIEEIGRRRHAFGLAISPDLKENKFYHEELVNPSVISHLSPLSCIAESRWMGNMGQLETAYFSMRYRMQHPETDNARRADNDALRNRENWYLAHDYQEKQDCTDRVGSFFDGLCKYARYNKFAVRGVLRNGEFNSSANVICSLSFDRDEDYFATAGISKKIKIFEFDALFNQSVDIHYPVIEMSNRSKLSCICWNNYIRNYLASTDYDGVVKLWDASTGQGLSEFSEHEKRAWSVDFSPVYPTKLASGSDDCSVKLWSINERSCLGTIRNKANVCCVQFSAHSTHLLAFGSADYRTYCYDLRNARIPWCILTGHEKAVSYVKFMDSETVITASTDNTLKLWDLNKTNPSGLSSNACSLTFRGHTNEKNFVGLSVANGYITCGSETNEVFAYHRSLPMPITSYKFGSIDPISGKETDDDNGQFVSSVCWRRKSDMIVAANSSGCIKVLEML